MHRRKRRWRLYLFLIVALGIWAFVGLRSRLWPVVRSLARTQVTNRASDLINDAILEQIMEGQIQYDRIVYFEKDLNGRITALKTNMAEVNRLKTETLNIINDEIMAEDTEHLGGVQNIVFRICVIQKLRQLPDSLFGFHGTLLSVNRSRGRPPR